MKAYCGYINDTAKLRMSASGGLATALAEHTVNAGGIVYGVAYTQNFRKAEYIRITTLSDIEKIQGSKYIKAELNGVIYKVAEDLRAGNKVLFVGLPCEVGALLVYLNKKGISKETLITVDLICQGPTTPRVAEQFIDRLENRFRSPVKRFSVRFKKPHWIPAYLYAEFENGKVFCEEFYKTDYGIAFSLMPMESCYQCKFKGENHVSDITIGDYWGSEQNDDGYNALGTSIAFVHSDKGDSVLHALEAFTLCVADVEKALAGNPRYSSSVERSAQRTKMRNSFSETDLHSAVVRTIGFRRNLTRKIPSKVIGIIKRIVP